MITIFKGFGNVKRERADRFLQSHCTYRSADGRMKLIFWGRQCRHISFTHCKVILSGGSRDNIVHLDRLQFLTSASCTVSDGLASSIMLSLPACLTTAVLTLSLVWYTHSLMDSIQDVLWQDEEIKPAQFTGPTVFHINCGRTIHLSQIIQFRLCGPCGQYSSININSPFLKWLP